MMPRNWGSVWLTLAWAGLAAGCGRVAVYNEDVQGTVKFAGNPVANVRVEFVPQGEPGTRLPPSSAYTDSKGHFQLTCDNQQPGAVVGKHHVIVHQGRGAGKLLPIPAAYSVASQTPWKVEVTQERHAYDLEIKPSR